ncbi:DMBT1-like protein, partial [Plecturocebus cupreus]
MSTCWKIALHLGKNFQMFRVVFDALPVASLSSPTSGLPNTLTPEILASSAALDPLSYFRKDIPKSHLHHVIYSQNIMRAYCFLALSVVANLHTPNSVAARVGSVSLTTVSTVLSILPWCVLSKCLLQEYVLSANMQYFCVSPKDWPQLQLVNGSGRCSGHVEVFYHGQWGRVWDDQWDLNEADMVCRQLHRGCALAAPAQAQFGQGRGEFLLDDVNCTGKESYLGQCLHASWGLHNCGPREDASIICAGSGHLSLHRCPSHDQDCISTHPTGSACTYVIDHLCHLGEPK